jgi:hypothetical protein
LVAADVVFEASIVLVAWIRSGNLDTRQKPHTVIVAVLMYPYRAEKLLQQASYKVSQISVEFAHWIRGSPD